MKPENITHLLLDLDGTLLHFDLDTFVRRYLDLVQAHFQDHPESLKIPDWILEGTGKMLANQGGKTNKEVFLNYFSQRSGLSDKEIWQRFMDFYTHDFNQLETIIEQNPQALTFIESAVAGGYSLVIATQPVFPDIAIRQRLRWAGLENITFKLITDITIMRSCKPHASYFRQILEILNVKPDECLMIGDDPVNDMASSEVGIPNYYIGDGPEREGDFEHLARILNLA